MKPIDPKAVVQKRGRIKWACVSDGRVDTVGRWNSLAATILDMLLIFEALTLQVTLHSPKSVFVHFCANRGFQVVGFPEWGRKALSLLLSTIHPHGGGFHGHDKVGA